MLLDAVDQTGTVRRVVVDEAGKIVTTKTRGNFSGIVGSAPVVVDLSSYEPPFSVGLTVGPGNTSRWEYSRSLNAAQNPAAAKWWPGSQGDVTSDTDDVILGTVTAVRFTRVIGSANDAYEVMV